MDESRRHRDRYPLRVLIARTSGLFRPYFGQFAGTLILLVLQTATVVAGPWLIKRAIDHDIRRGDLTGLWLTVGAFTLTHFAGLGLLYWLRNWLERIGQSMMAELRRTLTRHLIALPLGFHDRTSPGELLSRVSSDTQALRMLFTTTAVALIGDVFLFGGMFAVMLIVSPRLAAITAVAVPLLAAMSILFQRRIHPIFVEVRRKNAAISGRLTEYLHTLPVIHAFARQRWFLNEFRNLTADKYQTQKPGEKLIILWFNLMFLVQMLTFAAILGFGGYWASAGLVSVGTLVMFIGYVRRFFEPLLRLSEQLTVVQRAMASAERIFLLLDETNPITNPPAPAPMPAFERELRFDDVWFRYDPDGEWVLKGISFVIPAGESWAVVGPTGSGKTTIINLILRFHDPQRGRITIDGVDIQTLRLKDLRHAIGLVQQEIYLFPGGLRENLTLGDPEAETRLDEVLHQTAAAELIERLPEGERTVLTERGGNLSLGERQLLSLTRALVRDPKLVILDEATSAVDPATERRMVERTRDLLAGRTGLMIAHRLSTIRDCDGILVLSQGELIQTGTHAELVEQPGLFRDLHQLQWEQTA